MARSTRLLAMLFVTITTLAAQQQQGSGTQAPKAGTTANQPQIDYVEKAAEGSIFIYDGSTKPCEEQPKDKILIPLGSGFVVGITNKSVQPKEGEWTGWKILITAGHVIRDVTSGSIIVRLNSESADKGFVCFPIPLIESGDDENLFLPKKEEASDVAAILLPVIPGTDPVVFAPSLLLDRATMAKDEVKIGTNILTVGYFYGYSGQKQNYPITKFGKISILSSEAWYFNPDWKRYEQAYVVELQNTPGLSGSPVITYGFEFQVPFRYRQLPPYVIGIVKGLVVAPVGIGNQVIAISQGIAAVEPATHVTCLVHMVAEWIKSKGGNASLD